MFPFRDNLYVWLSPYNYPIGITFNNCIYSMCFNKQPLIGKGIPNGICKQYNQHLEGETHKFNCSKIS